MSTEAGSCPYCGQLQPPSQEPYRRCSRCNLFLRPADLAPGSGGTALDAVSRDFCPWCAFPVAREHSLPEKDEFVCPGCSGTLTADMLETQASINAYRKRPLSGFGYLLFMLALIAVVIGTLVWIVP